MYKVAGVDPEHSLKKFCICSMGAKRIFGNVHLGFEKADTYLYSQKKQDIYGTEELNFQTIFR